MFIGPKVYSDIGILKYVYWNPESCFLESGFEFTGIVPDVSENFDFFS